MELRGLERWLDVGGVSCWRMEGRAQRAGSTWQRPIEGEVWVWLNRTGEGMIWGAEDRMFLRPGMYAIFGDDSGGRWRWTRLPGEHSVEVVVISRAWLARRLGGREGLVHPDFSRWLGEGGKLAFAGLMTAPEKALADGLAGLDPGEAATPLRIEARILEWAAVRLFRRGRGDAGAGFCHQLGVPEPVERALRLLEARMESPLDLADLGKRCGVSPTHLSRLVKRRTGRGLREHQRRIRIESACELLRDPGARVTEVALEVGYQSLSHFAKAFREETGKSPSEWRSAG